MTAIHFQATYQDGKIIVPIEFQEKMEDEIEVVVLLKTEASSVEPVSENFLQQMMQNPKKVKGFKPLKRNGIYTV